MQMAVQAYVTVSVTAGYQIGSGGTPTVPYTQSPSVSCAKTWRIDWKGKVSLSLL